MENQPQVVMDDVVVSLDYILKVDGEVVDSTLDSPPLQYIQGHRNIIQGLESELAGMKIGDTKDVQVKAADAYGEFDPNAMVVFQRNQFPPSFEIQVGAEIHVRGGNGQTLPARIYEIDGDDVRLDLNHPLAGKDLLFMATISDLRAATEVEISMGRIGGGCAGCSGGDCGSGCG